jgi:hypothetical protein
LQEKDEEGGCDALPLLCLETNDNMGGMVCLLHLLLHEQNKIKGDWFPPLLLPLQQINNKMNLFVKKKKEKLTSLEWLRCVARNKKRGS